MAQPALVLAWEESGCIFGHLCLFGNDNCGVDDSAGMLKEGWGKAAGEMELSRSRELGKVNVATLRQSECRSLRDHCDRLVRLHYVLDLANLLDHQDTLFDYRK